MPLFNARDTKKEAKKDLGVFQHIKLDGASAEDDVLAELTKLMLRHKSRNTHSASSSLTINDIKRQLTHVIKNILGHSNSAEKMQLLKKLYSNLEQHLINKAHLPNTNELDDIITTIVNFPFASGASENILKRGINNWLKKSHNASRADHTTRAHLFDHVKWLTTRQQDPDKETHTQVNDHKAICDLWFEMMQDPKNSKAIEKLLKAPALLYQRIIITYYPAKNTKHTCTDAMTKVKNRLVNITFVIDLKSIPVGHTEPQPVMWTAYPNKKVDPPHEPGHCQINVEQTQEAKNLEATATHRPPLGNMNTIILPIANNMRGQVSPEDAKIKATNNILDLKKIERTLKMATENPFAIEMWDQLEEEVRYLVGSIQTSEYILATKLPEKVTGIARKKSAKPSSSSTQKATASTTTYDYHEGSNLFSLIKTIQTDLEKIKEVIRHYINNMERSPLCSRRGLTAQVQPLIDTLDRNYNFLKNNVVKIIDFETGKENHASSPDLSLAALEPPKTPLRRPLPHNVASEDKGTKETSVTCREEAAQTDSPERSPELGSESRQNLASPRHLRF